MRIPCANLRRFSIRQNEARPTVLLGAGASFSSGVPLADESVKRIARRYLRRARQTGRSLPEQVKTSEWMAWLAEQTWFIRDPARLAENFPLAVKHLLTPQAYRQKVLLDLNCGGRGNRTRLSSSCRTRPPWACRDDTDHEFRHLSATRAERQAPAHPSRRGSQPRARRLPRVRHLQPRADRLASRQGRAIHGQEPDRRGAATRSEARRGCCCRCCNRRR